MCTEQTVHISYTESLQEKCTRRTQRVHKSCTVTRLEVILYDGTAKMLHNMCTYYTYNMHILCTLCTHNSNCYTQYLHFVCSKICIACTMCAHFIEMENIILFALKLCILSFLCSFSLSLLYCISRFRKHIFLIKHEPSTLIELRKAFKSSIIVV